MEGSIEVKGDAVGALLALAEQEGDRELVRICEAARRGDARALATVEETWLVRAELGSNDERSRESGSNVSHPVRTLRTG